MFVSVFLEPSLAAIQHTPSNSMLLQEDIQREASKMAKRSMEEEEEEKEEEAHDPLESPKKRQRRSSSVSDLTDAMNSPQKVKDFVTPAHIEP